MFSASYFFCIVDYLLLFWVICSSCQRYTIAIPYLAYSVYILMKHKKDGAIHIEPSLKKTLFNNTIEKNLTNLIVNYTL